MVFGSIISSPRGSLSLQQALDLANIYLENARNAQDPKIALVLCHDTEVSLSHVKKVAKHIEDKVIREGIATAYVQLGELLHEQGHQDGALAFYKKSEKWGGRAHKSGRPTLHSRPASIVHSTKSALHSTADTTTDKPEQSPSQQSRNTREQSGTATISRNIFTTNVRPPAIAFIPPEPDSRLTDTIQLACCLELLQGMYEPEDILDSAARNWLLTTKNEPDEKDRLNTLATDVIRAFKRDEFKDATSVNEVVSLAPVLVKDDFRYLLKEFYSGIDQSGLLDLHQLDGLANLIQGADAGYLDSDDLVKVLSLLSTRLRDTHQQSTHRIYQLTAAVSHVLDAMADSNVTNVDREKIHEPLSSYLDGLKSSSDAYLVYQAAYAYQALLCVPDDESLWQATLRRSGKVIQGVSGLVSAVKGLDVYGFIEGLGKIQEGLKGAGEIVQIVKTAYDGVKSLGESGQGFLSCLKEGFSFSGKCAWYSALRGADALIIDGQFADFRKLVCEAPCRYDAAFQWGVCQRLGQVAANPKWDTETRQSAIAFLGEMYRNDYVWGYQANVKQWIVDILMQLSTLPGSAMQFAETQLQELRSNGDASKQTLYRRCRENGHVLHPLKAVHNKIGSPSLLDRVQERPDVEGTLRQLRRLRLKERGNIVYIHPQAKAGLQAHDDARFPLMEKVEEFLESNRKVLLLMGDSGAGKSTFNRELECHLWQSYKKNGTIPLHINLPAIDKPEHDIIAKQLRKVEFTEPQIRELKLHRKFTLICDGYDESQQTHNLYSSNRLNQPGEWNAKMVISCRSEYLGADYRDHFQPGDRNSHSGPSLLQEAVITPFSMAQVDDYIAQYVSVHRPLWEASEYKKALDLIPSLKELVKNPFLMSLSLEVLPRMVDPGQDLSATRITRTALYDQFIEHWLERGKKRLGEKNLSPQARAAFENLVDEGFARNGIDYLKKLSAAIYREQDGQPIVTYSRYKDENTWKREFFSREEEKQLLREACPLIRNGNQHRFIHRSLLEYGVALAIFDPQELKANKVSKSSLTRRMSTVSVVSLDGHDPVESASAITGQESDFKSPLAWRSFVNEPSVLQFLEERVQQEPLFKQSLLEHIEHSKKDKKWRTAASNAITILVRAGVQFIGADLQGIQIPGADISYGMFDSVQLQGADLRHVDLRGAWMRGANLSRVQMTDVQFGELPLLKQEYPVLSCAYSSDGKTIAVGIVWAKITVYSTSDWKHLWTLENISEVKSMAYSPNNDQIASGCLDGTVRLWSILTGACIHLLKGHFNCVQSVAYSPQGHHVASASHDKTVKVWDVETGECCYIWIGHAGSINGVVYSPQGGQIASNSYDEAVRLWNIDTETCHVLRGHNRGVLSIAYSRDGDQLASASHDKTVRLWNVATGECQRILTGHTGSVYFVIYSPNGDQVASCSLDSSVRLWDIERGVCLRTLLGHIGSVQRIAYSPQGDLIASASKDNTVRLWDVETGICRQTLTGHSGVVNSAAFSPKGDHVASGSMDCTVRLWDVGTGTSRRNSSGHGSSLLNVELSPKGDQIATCGGEKTARLWDVETGTCFQTLRGHEEWVHGVVYSPQGDQIATCSSDKTVRLWNAETGECTHILIGHSQAVRNISYSPDGDSLASTSDDCTVRIWDVESRECRHTLTGHYEYGDVQVVFSPTGSQVISYSRIAGNLIWLWDTETGVCNKCLRSGDHYSGAIVAYSPQGNEFASTSSSTIRVRDAITGECRHTLIGHSKPVSSVTYSPIANQIVSGSMDGSLRVWDPEARTCLWTLTGHTGRINRIVYSPRGEFIVSASIDKSARLWDVTSGQCRAVIQGFQGAVNDIKWIESSNVNYLATASQDGTVGMWRVSVGEYFCHVSLHWMATNGELNVRGATIQDVQGLSYLNKQLLEQRGAVGEPAHRLREAGKKLVTMTSVVSKLKTPSDTERDLASTISSLVEQLQSLERDPVWKEFMAVTAKDIDRSK